MKIEKLVIFILLLILMSFGVIAQNDIEKSIHDELDIKRISHLSLSIFEIDESNGKYLKNCTIRENYGFDFIELLPVYNEQNKMQNIIYKCYYKLDEIYKIEVFKNRIPYEVYYFKCFEKYIVFTSFKVIENKKQQYLGYFCNVQESGELFFIGFNHKAFSPINTLYTNDDASNCITTYKFIKESDLIAKYINKIIKLNSSLAAIYCWDFNKGNLFAVRKINLSKYEEVIYLLDLNNCLNICDLSDCDLSELKYISCEPLMVVPVMSEVEGDFEFCNWRNYLF